MKHIDWHTRKLGSVIKLEYGYGLPETARSETGFPVYGSNGIVGRHSEFLVNGPGIIVGRKGSVGEIRWSDRPFWPIDTTYYVVPHVEVELRWCFWLLQTLGLSRLYSSTGVPGLNRNDVYRITVATPPVPEQRYIAEVLDTIDETIQNTEALIDKLKAIKQGLLHDLLTRGLDENGKLRDPKTHPEQFKDSQLGLIPCEWKVRSIESLLKDVTPSMRSGPFGSSLLKSEFRSEGIPLVGIDNIEVEKFVSKYHRFVSERKYHELKRYTLRPNDVIITIMGTVGQCCIAPSNIGRALSSKHVWALTIDDVLYDRYLICLQLNYAKWILNHFRRHEQGGIMSAIRSETLREALVPMPPKEEQERIASVLKVIGKRIETEKGFQEKLKLQKKGLMHDLLTGKVRAKADAL
jgi:type I restriction enzyme S subunit